MKWCVGFVYCSVLAQFLHNNSKTGHYPTELWLIRVVPLIVINLFCVLFHALCFHFYFHSIWAAVFVFQVNNMRRVICGGNGTSDMFDIDRLKLEIKYLNKDKAEREQEIKSLRATITMLSKKMSSNTKQKAQSLVRVNFLLSSLLFTIIHHPFVFSIFLNLFA